MVASPAMRSGMLLGGKYRLRRLLGEGAAGAVWAAQNELTEREVAVKVIADRSTELGQRLLREARACGRISHRNVVEIYDVGQTESGEPFLVMQLLTGEPLSTRLKREKPLPPPLAAHIACEIARGLGAAHRAGIVHRDLKPANVFLHEPAGEQHIVLKVVDFGISKLTTEQDSTATSTGIALGSPAYMSPEQARGDRGLDARSDVWALGVVLYEMLVGQRPFLGDTPYTVVNAVLTAPIPNLRDTAPHVPAPLADIVTACLQRDPARRLPSADVFADTLLPFSAGPAALLPTHGQAPPPRAPAPSLLGGTASVPSYSAPLPHGAAPTYPAQPAPPQAAPAHAHTSQSLAAQSQPHVHASQSLAAQSHASQSQAAHALAQQGLASQAYAPHAPAPHAPVPHQASPQAPFAPGMPAQPLPAFGSRHLLSRQPPSPTRCPARPGRKPRPRRTSRIALVALAALSVLAIFLAREVFVTLSGPEPGAAPTSPFAGPLPRRTGLSSPRPGAPRTRRAAPIRRRLRLRRHDLGRPRRRPLRLGLCRPQRRPEGPHRARPPPVQAAPLGRQRPGRPRLIATPLLGIAATPPLGAAPTPPLGAAPTPPPRSRPDIPSRSPATPPLRIARTPAPPPGREPR
ncbi:MAG: protein kinase [Polyangiaceae bacterium]